MRKKEKGKGGEHVVEGVIITMGGSEVGRDHNRARGLGATGRNCGMQT